MLSCFIVCCLIFKFFFKFFIRDDFDCELFFNVFILRWSFEIFCLSFVDFVLFVLYAFCNLLYLFNFFFLEFSFFVSFLIFVFMFLRSLFLLFMFFSLVRSFLFFLLSCWIVFCLIFRFFFKFFIWDDFERELFFVEVSWCFRNEICCLSFLVFFWFCLNFDWINSSFASCLFFIVDFSFSCCNFL